MTMVMSGWLPTLFAAAMNWADQTVSGKRISSEAGLAAAGEDLTGVAPAAFSHGSSKARSPRSRGLLIAVVDRRYKPGQTKTYSGAWCKRGILLTEANRVSARSDLHKHFRTRGLQ